jgi:ribose transport system substrate-binding protein
MDDRRHHLWPARRVSRRAVASGALLALGGVGPRSSRSRGAGQPPAYALTFVPTTAGDRFNTTLRCGIEAAAARLGLPVPVTREPPAWDLSLQTNIIKAAVKDRPDAMFVSPVDPVAMVPLIRAVIAAGVTVITVDTDLDQPIALANVGSDQPAGGRAAAQILAQLVGGRGTVLVIDGAPGIPNGTQRDQAFRAELAAHFPGIRTLATEYCLGYPELASELVSARIRDVPGLAGVFGTFGRAAIGAADGIDHAQLPHRARVVGFDADPEQVEVLRAGAIDALVVQHPEEIGEEAVRIAVAYLTTGVPPAQRTVRTGFTIVTRANVDHPNVASRLYVADCAPRAAAPGTPVTAL